MKHYQDAQTQVKTRRWSVAIILVVVCCLGLTALGASIVHRRELQIWQNHFAEMAQIQKSSLQSLLEQRLELVEYLTVLYELVEQKRIPDEYIHTILARYPEIDHIGWSVEVLGSDRAAFVKQMRARGQDNFEIMERDASGEFVTADERERYYPLVQAMPEFRFAELAGRSPTSSYCPDSIAIQQAIERKSIIVADPMPMPNEPTANSLRLYLPVFQSSAGKESERLDGLISMHLKLDDMMVALFKKSDLIESYLNLYLIDVTHSREPVLLYGAVDSFSHAQLKILKTAGVSRKSLAERQERTIIESLFFANRHWTLFIQPSAKLNRERTHWAFMVVLTAGLVLTALLFALLTSFARHAKKVQARVDERTRQLSDANTLLAEMIRTKEKALDDLSKSEVRFRLLTESSTDIIARHDMNGNCLYASAAAKQLLGYEVSEMLGRSIYALLYKGDIDAMQRVFKAMRRSDEVYTIVYQARHKDGHYVWFEASCLSIQNPETSEVSEVQSVSRDITARKEAEEALRENEERFRGAFEDAAIGMALVEANGLFQRVNHSLCQLTGYAREELINSDLKNMTHPADMVEYSEKVKAVVEGRIRVLNMEIRLIHKKGHILWTLMNATLVSHNGDGGGYFVYQIQDISDRKKAEKALETLSTRHKLILNAAGEGIVGVSIEGKITFANVAAEKMLGYKQGELQGKPFHSWILHTRKDGSPYPFRESPLFQALHLGKTVSVDDDLFWCENQSSFISSYVCAPIQSDDTISGGVIVFSDVAEGMISQMAKKLMRGESTARKRIWTEES